MDKATFAAGLSVRAEKPDGWRPLLVPKEQIDAQVARLLEGPMPKEGTRSASIVHPQATDGVLSLTAVTEVVINVLRPGESEVERRGNYSLLETCVQGSGHVSAGREFDVSARDVWTVPSMQVHTYRNTSDEPWVRLSYSNAPFLKRVGAIFSEIGPFNEAPKIARDISKEQSDKYNRQTGFDHEMGSSGSRLRSYEFLTDIEPVPNPAQHWSWSDVAVHLPLTSGDNNDPSKRGIWLLYNPATERRQGTTQTHFATYSGSNPDTPMFKGTRGHRHISASINYHVTGKGFSIVDGQRIDWKAGDLLFSAPTWSEHAHYSEGGRIVLTVQDHPMHIGMGSLLWQENIEAPILSLGNEDGQKGYVGPRMTGS